MTTRIRRVAGLVGAVCLLAATPAAAEGDIPFVDGTMWLASNSLAKRSYLIGISNLLSAEYAYQQKFGPPPDNKTAIQRLYEEIDDLTLDGSIARIEAWYKNNPDKHDEAVLGVIWLDMVEPNLPESRKYEGEDR